jgi:HAD superfamily hydrolase (TIGR01450 family)
VVADDGGIEAQATEGGGGYHGAAGLGFWVMAVFVASAGRPSPAGLLLVDPEATIDDTGHPLLDHPNGTLAGRFRGVVLDLDGVVYLGEEVIAAAPGALDQVRGLGVKVAFVTNNSYRPPGQVAEKLNRLGVKAAEGEVLTSAQAAVRLLGGHAGLRGVRVLVVGGPGLRQALEGAGARLIDGPAWREAEVVAVGFDPELTYGKVRDATLAIRAGARFVGSNPDTTLPTREGLWPGAGSTLALLRASTGVRPEVAGKPERALLDTAAAAIGPGPYLMVGDRADTDLDGAHRLGWSTALVLSGVTRLPDLPDLANPPDQLLADVGGLLDRPGPVVRPATAADEVPAARLLGGGVGAGAAGGAGSGTAGGAEGAGGPSEGTGGSARGAGGPLVVVAADGERVAGAAAVRPAGTLGVLDGPVVEEAWRGRLVGTRLAAAACIQARAVGLRRVAAPAAAEPFLTRLGFRRAPGQDPPLVRDLVRDGG